MRTIAVVAVVTAGLASTAGRDSAAQKPWPSNLERISVLVSDSAGRPVSGLQREDFQVSVDDRPISIDVLYAQPEDLVVVVLLDVTSSLHENPHGVAGLASSTRIGTGVKLASPNFPELIAPAVQPFDLKGLRSGDVVRIGAITRNPKLGPVLDGASQQLSRQWKDLFDLPPVEWLGPSPIFDAVSQAVDSCGSQTGQRAVVLMTDGLASGNLKGHREVAAEAALSGVSISVVAEPAVPKQIVTADRDPVIPLQTLASSTGGIFILDRVATYEGPLGEGAQWSVGERQRSFQRVFDHLHQGYALGIVPIADGKLHRLDVTVKNPALSVHARKGYVVAER